MSGVRVIEPASAGSTMVFSAYFVTCAAAPTSVPSMTRLAIPAERVPCTLRNEKCSFSGASAVAVNPLNSSLNTEGSTRGFVLLRFNSTLSFRTCLVSPASTAKVRCGLPELNLPARKLTFEGTNENPSSGVSVSVTVQSSLATVESVSEVAASYLSCIIFVSPVAPLNVVPSTTTFSFVPS